MASPERVPTYGAFPSTLAQIGTTTGAAVGYDNSEFIDAVLTGGINSGYNLNLMPGTQAVPSASLPSGCMPGYSDGYVATANPVTVGTTGQRAFCSDATGEIRSNPTGTASYTAPLCDPTQNPLQ